MSWIKSKLKKSSEELCIPHLRFLGEQDGLPERELKNILVELFRDNSNVAAGYLAQVTYNDQPGMFVALCLRSKNKPDYELNKKIEKHSRRCSDHTSIWIFSILMSLRNQNW